MKPYGRQTEINTLEVKKRIRLEELKIKAKKLLASYPDYAPTFLALSLEDARDFL